MASTTPCNGPISRPVRAKWASCRAATSSASSIPAALSVPSVILRALRSSKPHARRAAGRRFNVIRALILPAFLIVETGPSIPLG